MIRITVRITPNAKTNEIVAKENGTWKIRLHAPPIDGRANKALIEFLAKEFDCAPSSIRILKGHGSKIKLVEVE